MNFLHKWYGLWLAGKIEEAVLHDSYCGEQHQYLCSVLKKEIGGLGAILAAAHIADVIAPHHTLHNHLQAAVPNFPGSWQEREVYHRRFFLLMAKHLKQGDIEWGRKPNLEELGMAHLAQKDKP